MLSEENKEKINKQIKKNEHRIETLEKKNNELKTTLFKDKYLFKPGDIITDGERKVRFVEYVCVGYGEYFNVVYIRKDGTEGTKRKIDYSFKKWRYFVQEA